MVNRITAPPWEDVGHLLSFGAYMYVLLVALAIACATMYRSSFLRRLAAPSAPLQYSFATLLSVAAISEFFARHAITMAIFRMIASTGICIFYVYSTYIGYIGEWLLLLRKLLGSMLTLQFVGKMLVAHHPISFVLGGESVMEVFSLASLIMAKSTDWLNFSFLQAYIVLSRYFQIEPALELVFMQKTSPFHRQLTRLTLEFIVFIYVFACGLQLFERLGDPWQTLTATTFELTLANSFYFTVVTIFTVGYGDFVPYTLMGRLWIICIIVFGAYLVSRKIGQVVDVVSGLRRGLGSFVKGEGVQHCVICGNVKWEYLKSFVEEFYGDTRNLGKKLVVICDQPNWTEGSWNKFFTSHAQFRNNVVYLEGSCVTRDDLERAQVENSKAVFVLNNQHNPDPYAEDSETLKRILTIRSYTPNLPIYSMCALRDSMLQITYALEHLSEIEAEESMSKRGSVSTGINMISQEGRRPPNEMLRNGAFGDETSGGHPASAYYSGDFDDEDDDDDGLLVPNYDGSSDLKSEAICMQEVEMSLLAENVFCNGLSTLLANLILRVNPQTKPADQPWAVEYKIGSECRFEYVKLPMDLHDRKFSEIATIMYDYGVLLIATKRFMDKKWRAITPDTTIHLSTIGLIITFHSTHFLEKIMLHIAARVREMFSEALSDPGSQDIPSPDDEFSARRGVPRYNIAGDFLTGDVPLAYEYEAEDELVTQPPAFQNTGRSWPGGPRVLDPGLPLTSTQVEPRSDPRSLPEPSISVSPLGGVQRRDPTKPLIFTRTAVPESRVGFSTADDRAAVVREDREGGLPAVAPQMSNLRLDVSRVESTLATETSEDDLDTGFPRSYPNYPNATAVRNEPGKGDENVATKPDDFQLTQNPANASAKQSTEDDQAHASEEGPASALRTSAFHSGASPRRKTPRAKDQHVSFHYQKARTTSGPSKKTGDDGGGPSGLRKQGRNGNNASEHPFMFFGDDELPMKVKGHIVVCTIGKMAMMNLKHFLQRVWIPRGPSTEDTPVVAICPRLTEEDEADLAGYASERLFLIQGNSLSVKTLRRAQFDQAKAIVILACEDKNDLHDMDAKAIFTVMTLDYLLGERSETFVCTMLDAEESMQLLRAPANPRRVGADLGREREYFLEFGIAPNSARGGFSRFPSSASGQYRASHGRRRDGFDSKRSIGERTYSFGALSGAGDLPRSMSFVGIRNSTYTNRRAAIERRLGIRDTRAYPTSRKFSLNSFGAYRNPLIRDDEDIMNNPSVGGASALNFLMNPSTITMGGGATLHFPDGTLGRGRGLHGSGASRARDESFEKQRYASGEMVISSTYMSLLIREYAMPGLMAVVRKIFGAGIGKNARSKRCWIRTIQIPRQWMTAGQGGRRTYREVFETLLEHGAVALGLYRSGDVMVRIQLEEDSEFEEEGSVTSRCSTSERRYHQDFGDGGPSTPQADEYDSANVSDEESHALEIGGDSVPRLKTSRSFERSAILQNLPSYGTMQGQDTQGPSEVSSREGNRGTEGEGGGAARVNISPTLLFDIAEDVHAAQQSSEAGSQEPQFQSYRCPSSGRRALFKEVPGGENVLPYVYTNPEAYTLVSEHDAVYVLISPQLNVPTDNW